MTIHEYSQEIDRAMLRVSSRATRQPLDRDAAIAVMLLAAHWLTLRELSADLLDQCTEYMTKAEATELAQTLGWAAMRGATMGTKEVRP